MMFPPNQGESSRVRKQNHFLSFGNKSTCYSLADKTSGRIPTVSQRENKELIHKDSQHFQPGHVLPSLLHFAARAYASYNSRGIMGYDPHTRCLAYRRNRHRFRRFTRSRILGFRSV